jgi:hypothetical protein
MELDDFLAEERAEGRQVSANSAFTLNPAEVRSRVATFCSEERLYPLYRCLQAILRVCQSDLFLRYEGESWVASFLWPNAPSAKHFQSFLTDGAREGFDNISHTATQHFFFGLSAALGVPHYRMSLKTPRGGFRVHNGKLELAEETSPEYCQLAFSIDAGWWEKLTGGKRQKSDTEESLRRRLCYSAVPVHVEGQRLVPVVPEPPDRPWASRLADGSNLAWRYLVATGGGRLHPPEVPLDRYRSGKKGTVYHLIKDDPERPLPLSVQFSKAPPTEDGSDPANPFAQEAAGDSPLCASALFLSLEAGRQDWLFPVRDGVLGEPMPIQVARGGVLVVAADDTLRYDLSGLRVVADNRLDEKLALWSQEAKALKSGLGVSVANISVRAEAMPAQYFQATGYSFAGPYAGMVAGRVGPWLKRLTSGRGKSD